MKEFTVYTTLFGNYDQLMPINFNSKISFYCFTDDENLSITGWEMKYVELTDLNFKDLSRLIKFKPHVFLPESRFTLYVDANIQIKKNLDFIFNKYALLTSIAIPYHRIRNCLYEEAIACAEVGLIKMSDCSAQLDRYRHVGFPICYGLTENGIIFRKNTKEINMLMDEWWKEYCYGVKRDQISLPYLCWKMQIEVYELEETAFNKNNFFQYRIHKKNRRSNFWGCFKDYILERKYKNKLFYLSSLLVSSIKKAYTK